MRRICFGQNFEDVVLWRALGHVQAGRYLDIGAQHPVIDSISQSFYREGWRGVHVEPAPQYADALRKDRPDETVIEAAAGDQPGPITLCVFPETGLSTTVPQVAQSHGRAGLKFDEIEVPVVFLDDLLDTFVNEDLHWLKIDVEGSEESVLRSWRSSTIRPWIVLIEAIDPSTGHRNDGKWRDLLETRHYHEVLFDGVNRYFVADERAELDESLRAPANCLDAFYVPRHHWSAAHAVAHCEADIAAITREAEQSEMDRDRLKAERDVAAAERDQTSFERGVFERQLVDLKSEHSTLTETVEHLRLELDRYAQRQEASIILSQDLRKKLKNADEARRHIEADLMRRATELQEAASKIDLLDAEVSELRDLAAERAAQLRSADEIVALAARHVRPWFRQVAALMSRTEQKSLRSLHDALTQWSSGVIPVASTTPSLPVSGSTTMDIFTFDHRDPYHRAPSLTELCRFSDANFIRCAFVTILGRQPDPNGESHYLAQLRSGASKLTIIGWLRRSAEGKMFDPGIAGLDKALRKHRNANRPFTGWIVRSMTGREGNSSTERRLRALCNQIDAEHARSAIRAATANHLILSLDHKVHSVEKQLRSAMAGRTISARRINQAEPAGDTEWASTLHTVLNG